MAKTARHLRKPEKLVLYRDESTSILRVDKIAEYLEEKLATPAEVRGDFFEEHRKGDAEELARRIAATRVRDLGKPFKPEEPLYGEVMFELRFLNEPSKKVPGILYDASRTQRLLREMLPPEERKAAIQHIVFTSRLIGTFEADGRYHAHVNLCGYPSIISTSGIVEAPAKPKEYYILKQKFAAAGEAVPFDLLKERFSGQFIDYDDPRMTEVMKGYALQCALHAITGEAFCSNRTCRLFNARWQSEVLMAQIESGDLCRGHEALLREMSCDSP